MMTTSLIETMHGIRESELQLFTEPMVRTTHSRQNISFRGPVIEIMYPKLLGKMIINNYTLFNSCPTGSVLSKNAPSHRTYTNHGIPNIFSMPCTNLKKADWDSYTREAEEFFALLGPPFSCSTGELLFRKILNTSAKHHIPQGHNINMITNLNETSKQLITERDTIRSSSPTDQQIQELTNQSQYRRLQ